MAATPTSCDLPGRCGILLLLWLWFTTHEAGGFHDQTLSPTDRKSWDLTRCGRTGPRGTVIAGDCAGCIGGQRGLRLFGWLHRSRNVLVFDGDRILLGRFRTGHSDR